jgi:flagellar biosynthesis/type III secretory pathway M-ring protein FliF/YscJ
MGFDEKRGDLFSLQNISFAGPAPEVLSTPNKFQRLVTFTERHSGLIRYIAVYTGILIAVFAGIYLLLLLPIRSKLASVLQLHGKDGATAAIAGGEGRGALPSNSDAQLTPAAALRRQLASSVKNDSEFTSRLIQSWLSEAEVSK